MVEKNQLKGDSNYMNKEIIIELTNKNEIILTCNGKHFEVKDNKLSALDIYNLLDYHDGDTYNVSTKGTKIDILNPFEELFNNLIKQIHSLKSVNSQVDKKLESFPYLNEEIEDDFGDDL